MMKLKASRLFLTILAGLFCIAGRAQNTLTQIDSTLFYSDIRDTLSTIFQKFGNIRFSGYIQTQYQHAQSEGASTYAGGNFQPESNSRFMMRRGRLRLDYLLLSEERLPRVFFVFQFDGTERGVNIRDFWGKFYENKYNVLSVTTGVFARPFGFEVNWSSMVREAPERARMSQILLQTERDIGVMVSFEPQRNRHALRFLKIDMGLFNGQGLPGFADFDSRKDLITRVTLRSVKPEHDVNMSGGVSYYYGGTRQFSKFVYTTGQGANGIKQMEVDSTATNIGKYSKRQYFSADAQLKLKHSWGATELRGEYWRGTQPGTRLSSTSLPTRVEAVLPRYIRDFDGAAFFFLQNIASPKHQVGLKYDWYDPNTQVEGAQIAPGSGLTEADIRYKTWGAGYVHYFNPHFKVTAWYDMVTNERTMIPDYTSDLEDNVFTLRVQYVF